MENTLPNARLNSIHRTLRLTFGIVPIVAGLDKFTNLLAHWSDYLAPFLVAHLPFSAAAFMHLVGVIEIIAGIIVLAAPRIGGAIVAAWLALIAVTLLGSGRYLDVAVRDLVMAIGAVTLMRLSVVVAPRGP